MMSRTHVPPIAQHVWKKHTVLYEAIGPPLTNIYHIILTLTKECQKVAISRSLRIRQIPERPTTNNTSRDIQTYVGLYISYHAGLLCHTSDIHGLLISYPMCPIPTEQRVRVIFCCLRTGCFPAPLRNTPDPRYDEMPRDEFGVPAHIPPEISTTIRHTQLETERGSRWVPLVPGGSELVDGLGFGAKDYHVAVSCDHW